MRKRVELVKRLEDNEAPDIVIIGAGCNGVGLYRDLALQGVKTLLIDKGDFGSGTSSASTRLAHGGLKYLETGEISLVKESTLERNLLILNAPHQVKPLPIWVPIKSWVAGSFLSVMRFLNLTKKLGPKGFLPVKFGLMFYDLFGNKHRTMDRHKIYSRKEALKLIPQLSVQTKVVAQYYDTLITHPERLIIELIEDAEQDCPGSMAVSYFKFDGCSGETVSLTDTLTGETYSLKAQLVINTSGAWVDEVQASLGYNEKLVGGTRGSHLVVRNEALAKNLSGRMLYFEADDYRAVIALHLGGDRLFLGATDILTNDPNEKLCTDAEVDYIIKVMKSALPNVEISPKDIIYSTCGVRPLPYSSGTDPGLISRDHKLHKFAATKERDFPIFTLVGGKWTTYRAAAEEIADEVLDFLKLQRKFSTKNLKIGGGKDFPFEADKKVEWAKKLSLRAKISEERAIMLTERYGSNAEKIALLENSKTEEFIATFSLTELRHILNNERVATLDDILHRRTLLAFEGMLTHEIIAKIGFQAADCLGWTKRRLQQEIAVAETLLKERHRVEVLH